MNQNDQATRVIADTLDARLKSKSTGPVSSKIKAILLDLIVNAPGDLERLLTKPRLLTAALVPGFIGTEHLDALYEHIFEEPDQDQSTLHKLLEESLSAADQRFESLGISPGPHLLKVFIEPGSEQLRIAVHHLSRNRAMPTAFWDLFDAPAKYPALAVIDLALSEGHQVEVLTTPPRDLPMPASPLYRFHPERFKDFHSSLMPSVKAYAQSMAGTELLLPTKSDVDRLMHAQLLGHNEVLSQLPIRANPDVSQRGSGRMGIEVMQACLAVANYRAAGRQIFDLPPSLVEMFRRTDIEDIPFPEINYPFQAQYIHFGPQKDMEIEPGCFIEGAYVTQAGGTMNITCVTLPQSRQQYLAWPLFGEPQYSQSFNPEHLSKTVGLAVEEVLSDRINEYQKRKNAPPITTEQLRASAVDAFESSLVEDIRVDDVSAKTATHALDTLTEGHRIYLTALRIVINALCYLTAYPDDIHLTGVENAPPKLLAAAGSGTMKERQKAISELEKLGFTAVHVCGQRIVQQKDIAVTRTGTGVRTHWRRGFWRRQPYGEGRALRKLKWLMPVLVNADQSSADTEPDGHIYLAS